MAQSLKLWPEQEQILARLHEGFLAGHHAQVLYGPCGFGKTEIAVSMLDATAIFYSVKLLHERRRVRAAKNDALARREQVKCGMKLLKWGNPWATS